ncbi:hypothetical protein DV738_g473, partial [Chaetothyriales sp. CBS 135597]
MLRRSSTLPTDSTTCSVPQDAISSPSVRRSSQTPVAESPATIKAINRLNQYSFVRNIGEGSFGKVKLARHKVTGQEVAMKTINRRKLISRDMAGRIEREIQYLQLLRHPHIIKLYTVITTKTDIYMVLEYVPMELFDYIVDVWSCGVILYVFLVGRLPFDDEFIPALFKKIQAGTFHIPSSIPPGAVNLIKQCLQVHPVHRITIPEIRQDEWFVKDLPDYLREPPDEFFDTGVDPSKAIDPKALAPGAPPEEVEQIHASVVSKLGRTMGYKKEDVNEALSKDEPSAIKDAYLIVRENHLMVETPQYKSHNPALENFMASSPPTDPVLPNLDHISVPRRPQEDVKPLTSSRAEHRSSRTLSETPSTGREVEKPRTSNVRVLPTSLPHVHHELLLLREKARNEGRDPNQVLHPVQVEGNKKQAAEEKTVPTPIPEEIRDAHGNPIYRSKEEQEATRSALKPHSRSVTQLSNLTSSKPDPMTTLKSTDDRKPAPRAKNRRWQFGIRSRNQPWEATKCLYEALLRCNATWNTIPATVNDNQNGEEDCGPPAIEIEPGEQHKILQYRYPDMPEDYYIPHDMNYIEARILKRGVHILGDQETVSTSSSVASLPSEAKAQLRRHIQQLGHNVSEDVEKALGIKDEARPKTKSPRSSEHSSRPQSSHIDQNIDTLTSSTQPPISRPDSLQTLYKHLSSDHFGIYVYMTIQIYQIESSVFVVDFKCDGYVNVVWSPSDKRAKAKSLSSADNGDAGEWIAISKRYKGVEKEVTSPYPFLDVAKTSIPALTVMASTRSATSQLTPYFLILVLTSTLGTLLFGFHLAELNAPQDVLTCVRSGVGKQSLDLPECIPMTSVQLGLVSSIYTIGGLVGALPAGLITSKYGRIHPMRINTLISFVGALAEAFAPSIPVLAIGRFVSGLAAGSSTVIVPLYISEIAPPNQKGFWGAFTQVSTNSGIVVTQVIGYFLSHGQYWRVIFGTASIIAAIQFFALFFAVESPIWAAENGQKEAAREALIRIRGEHPDLRREIDAARDAEGGGQPDEAQALLTSSNRPNQETRAKVQPIGFFEVVTRMEYLPAIIAVIATMFAQQLCGINSVVMYGVSLLATVLSAGSGLLNILISVLNVVSTTACAPLSDILGRKACILCSIAGMGTSSLLLGIGLRTETPILSAIAVLLFVASFGVGLGPVPYILASELVGPEAVGAVQSWAMAANWISTFLVAQFFPLLAEKMPKGAPYFLFAALAAFFFLFIAWWVPETKGKNNPDEI